MACIKCIPCIVSLCVFFMCIAGLLLGFNMSRRNASVEESKGAGTENAVESTSTWLNNTFMSRIVHLWVPTWMYRRLTWYNLAVFFLKYVPTGLYMLKMLRSIYVTSRERVKQKQMKLNDIQLEIQIAGSKLSIRDAEYSECTQQLQRCAMRLSLLRARVRDVIASDDVLSRAMQHATEASPAPDADHGNTIKHFTESECEFIKVLMKEPKGAEQYMMSEIDKLEHFEGNEQCAGDEESPMETSVYSSMRDVDVKQDCHVKFIKVTNVYKVSCLKHYIKQKRMRRATQQAMLKKKIESIKKLLESWQKSLNAVIYNKLSMDPVASVDMASQEAMGDYSKPTLRDFSDSDSELKTSCTDMCYDDYNNINWSQNPYYIMDNLEQADPKELFESSKYRPNDDINYSRSHGALCDCTAGGGMLFILPEETTSQVDIEDNDLIRL